MVKECGYQYDASYNSFAKNARYGHLSLIEETRRGIAYQLSEGFFELPISNLSLAGKIMPWGGGGYFRFIPNKIFLRGIYQILKQSGVYHFYMHPWEIDPDQPKMKKAHGINAWKHYINLDKTFQRLNRLLNHLGHCSFPTCVEYLGN